MRVSLPLVAVIFIGDFHFLLEPQNQITLLVPWPWPSGKLETTWKTMENKQTGKHWPNK
jgi:hypothetical protein